MIPLQSRSHSTNEVDANTFRELASRHKHLVNHPRRLVTFEFSFTDTSLSQLSFRPQRPRYVEILVSSQVRTWNTDRKSRSWPLSDDSASLAQVKTGEDDWRCSEATFSRDLVCLWAPAQQGGFDILGSELGFGPSNDYDSQPDSDTMIR